MSADRSSRSGIGFAGPWVILVLTLFFCGYHLRPLIWSKDRLSEEVYDRVSRTALSSNLTEPSIAVRVELSFLVYADVAVAQLVPVGRDEDLSQPAMPGLSARSLSVVRRVRVDLVALLCTPAVLCFAALSLLHRVRDRVAPSIPEGDPPSWVSVSIHELQERIRSLETYSTLLLFSGIFVAAAGAFFILSRPESRLTSDSWTEFLMVTLRPVGSVLLIEAIAFFLLRRHRVMKREATHLALLVLQRRGIQEAMRLSRTSDIDISLKPLLIRQLSQAIPLPDQETNPRSESPDTGGVTEVLRQLAAGKVQKPEGA